MPAARRIERDPGGIEDAGGALLELARRELSRAPLPVHPAPALLPLGEALVRRELQPNPGRDALGPRRVGRAAAGARQHRARFLEHLLALRLERRQRLL